MILMIRRTGGVVRTYVRKTKDQAIVPPFQRGELAAECPLASVAYGNIDRRLCVDDFSNAERSFLRTFPLRLRVTCQRNVCVLVPATRAHGHRVESVNCPTYFCSIVNLINNEPTALLTLLRDVHSLACIIDNIAAINGASSGR